MIQIDPSPRVASIAPSNEQLLNEAMALINRVSRNLDQPVTIRAGRGEYYPDRFYTVSLGGPMTCTSDMTEAVSEALGKVTA